MQLSLGVPRLSEKPQKSCHASEESCECFKQCPCAEKSDPGQPPAPLAPVSSDLKLLVIQPEAVPAAWTPPVPPVESAVCPAKFSEHWVGYKGVPLAVAFCRFVI